MRLSYRVLPADGVLRLTGPVRANVTVEARNKTRAANGSEELHHEPVYHYMLDVPPGHSWELTADHVDTLSSALGANDGVRVIVDPVPDVRDLVPPVLATRDLPCDLAVGELDGPACAVPRSCDPMPPGAMIAMPPDMRALVTTPARGGVVRPRYFNGLFLSRAELDMQQRRLRAAQVLQNRAHGAGVVWGLAPAFNGKTITVGVGYGIDCCGNDLLVTTPYEVVADALLNETNRTATRLHLLLEYVEVPEALRPVHDECAPALARCEPSRIRETVRLRLVPARDLDVRGPIDDLLATGLLEQDETGVAKTVPFDLWVRTSNATFDFPLGLEQTYIVLAGGANGADFETHTKPDWTLLEANVFFDDPNDANPPVQIGSLDPATGTAKWHITQTTANFWVTWKARGRGVHGTFTGTTRFVLFIEIDTGEERLAVEATEVTLVPDPPGHCYREPCDPQRPRFPTAPPWLHGYASSSDVAADPRVLELVLGEMGLGRTPDVEDTLRDALRDLARGWCSSLAWRGPVCDAEPHGIVIGCVRLDKGRIVDVDPWGGRRWAVRYGLVDHIARQVGMLPPDSLLSRLADLASCVARQRVPEPPPPVIIERTIDEVRRRVDRALEGRSPALLPLVRTFAAVFAAGIARSTEIATLPAIESPLAGRLAAAGVTTLDELLRRDPEALLASVGRDSAVALSRVLAAAEAVPARAAGAVADAIVATRADSRATLDRARIVKAVARSLDGVRADVIEAAFDQALQ